MVLALALGVGPFAAGQNKKGADDLKGYRTASSAITTKIVQAKSAAPGLPGFLGVHVVQGKEGGAVIDEVQPESPAARAGLRKGDRLEELAGVAIDSVARFREALLSKAPAEDVAIRVSRKGKTQTLQATLGASSRPMQVGGQRAILGVQVAEAEGGDGVTLRSVSDGLPAAKAGLKVGEVLVKLDGAALSSSASLTDAVAGKKPGDVVSIVVRRDGKDVELKLTLAADESSGRSGSWDTRTLTLWKKDVYRLAVVPIEYPDVKHNTRIAGKNWEEAIFSSKHYLDRSVTGQRVFGSVNDYYQEQSFGKLRVEGKVFDFIEAAKKRADYGQSTSPKQKTALLEEALDKLLERDGKDALAGFDGIFFLYAGGRVQGANRGGLYWPHRATFSHRGKRWSYFISSEGGNAMSTISVICHEFGHMLGLPDLYARPENPGSEGVGVWCAMSNQVGNGRPQHFGAWSKERLGWIDPVVIDPTVKQKLILAPIEDSPKECFKVLVKLDGSEHFLLENRKKKGFDQELPAEGLLIWRVVQNKPILEEAHGVEGPSGPRVFLSAVPFPSAANSAFTPYTMPSSRAQLGTGLPVWITNIRKLPDGRIAFWVGYEFF
jgi:M6 family metalloprotease-like protein